MSNKKQIKFLAGIILLMFFVSCNVFSRDSVPYDVRGEMVMEDSQLYDDAGFEYFFRNRSEKQVSSFTMVFFLFDEDGNSPLIGKNNIVLKVNASLDSFASITQTVSLDSYFNVLPDEPYEVDYLYISNIEYSDGTVWSDPFGLSVFY